MALKIYGVFRSRTSRVVWMAHELGIPFEHVPVIQARRLENPAAPDAPLNTTSPEYLAINPNGKIPCIDDDGLVMHESLAITLHLAKKHGGLLAPRNPEEDGLMTMWALWAVTACEPHTVQIIFHRVDFPESKRDEAVVSAAIAALRSPLQVLDASLRKGSGFLGGQRFTAADLNTAEVFRYAQPAPE